MEIVLFVEESGLPVVGIRRADTITSLGMTMAALLHEPLARIRGRVEQTSADEVDTRGVSFLAPIDGRTELWAAGVTDEISQQARMEESREAADVYERVYHADRPELFFKARLGASSATAVSFEPARTQRSTCRSRSSRCSSTRTPRRWASRSAMT